MVCAWATAFHLASGDYTLLLHPPQTLTPHQAASVDDAALHTLGLSGRHCYAVYEAAREAAVEKAPLHAHRDMHELAKAVVGAVYNPSIANVEAIRKGIAAEEAAVDLLKRLPCTSVLQNQRYFATLVAPCGTRYVQCVLACACVCVHGLAVFAESRCSSALMAC